MSPVRVIGQLDRNFGWDGSRLLGPADVAPGAPIPGCVMGATASVQAANGDWRVVRDPLGLNKLFFAERDGDLAFAARPRRLVGEGFGLEDLRAVPRGTITDLAGTGETRSAALEGPPPRTEADPATAGREIRASLDAYLSALAAAHRSAPAYVCLSGGLDSSGIAALASEHFPGAIAVSFDLVGEGAASQDRLAAEQVADELGMPLITADVDGDELLSHLDAVLVEGIDWRDFNVHAGLVNAVLAATIRAAAADGDALVLTGDLPNELLVDYHPEQYRGETFYELPRLPPARLRASLVRGLDTSHREVGVFEGFGLPVVQPYAVAVDGYMSLSEEFLGLPDRKERLCQAVFGDRVPRFVYERPKARAQLGGEGAGGVLGACLDRGVDADWLRRRFAQLHEVEDLSQLDRFIRAGRYRSAAPALAEEGS